MPVHLFSLIMEHSSVLCTMEDTENQREDEGLKQSLTSDINSLQEHRDVSVSE
jgi:hypothetical protein